MNVLIHRLGGCCHFLYRAPVIFMHSCIHGWIDAVGVGHVLTQHNKNKNADLRIHKQNVDLCSKVTHNH